MFKSVWPRKGPSYFLNILREQINKIRFEYLKNLNNGRKSFDFLNFPPASNASMEVANLTERKNPHTPVNGIKEFVCLSVTNFDPNYLRTGKTKWAKNIY